MLQSFEQTDFTDGSRWNSIIFLLKSDFLESHHLASDKISALVDDTVSSLSELLLALVAL